VETSASRAAASLLVVSGTLFPLLVAELERGGSSSGGEQS
jgi:hypothetical protein